MKDDFSVQRVARPAARPIEYRPVPGRVSVSTAQPPVSEPVAPVSPAAPKKRAGRPLFAAMVVILVLGVLGYVAAETWFTSSAAREASGTGTTSGASANALEQGIAAEEGSDETDVPHSAIDSYVVGADQPRMLSIDKVNIRARILPMGVTAQNAIQAPVNIFDSGWYTGSAKPGTPGIAFIDAHASGATREGLFAYLDTVRPGDTIRIERGDGTILKYAVRKLETQKLADINMTEVLSPQDGIEEGLTLMTCTGKWMADSKTYDQRVIVYAERVG